MIPSTETQLNNDFTVAVQPGKTYRLLDNRVIGFIDGLEAVVQSAMLILSTERFAYPLYSWNYGVELQNLFGTSPPLLYIRLQDAITDALTQDDRITGVTDFTFEQNGEKITVTCTLETIYGATQITKEFSYV